MHDWESIIVVIGSWVFCAGLNYGIIRTQVSNLEKRLAKLEDEKYVTRSEYESRHAELLILIHRERDNKTIGR